MQDKTFTELVENLKTSHQEKIKQLHDDFLEKRKNLIISMAKNKNPHKVGDKIKDAKGEIFITQVAYTLKENEPTCIFTGAYIKKINQKKRTMITRKIWLDDII